MPIKAIIFVIVLMLGNDESHAAALESAQKPEERGTSIESMDGNKESI